MTLRLVRAEAQRAPRKKGPAEPPSITCALVNNMPDGAFDATERQYLGLLTEGSGSVVVEVRRYTMTGVPRGPQTSKRVEEEYLALSDLYLDPPDALIITGSNPIEARIEDELYWADLVELLTWSRKRVRSILLSCLSAHAALTIFDDIPRVRLPTKCTGVFPQHVDVSRPLTRGLESETSLPHSRWNSVPRESLESVGYNVAVHSNVTGWSVASRIEHECELVLVQGHPEYDPSSLLREYRRDARRYVHHDRDDLPFLPYQCVSIEDWEQLERVHDEILNGARDPALIDQYPFDEVGARAPWPWRSMAQRLYANWLTGVGEGKD
ncbi:MAG TPA: homoserine O-succinyltransferase [Acidimicrobiales bacterium]